MSEEYTDSLIVLAQQFLSRGIIIETETGLRRLLTEGLLKTSFGEKCSLFMTELWSGC
jgi:hypothetical protein